MCLRRRPCVFDTGVLNLRRLFALQLAAQHLQTYKRILATSSFECVCLYEPCKWYFINKERKFSGVLKWCELSFCMFSINVTLSRGIYISEHGKIRILRTRRLINNGGVAANCRWKPDPLPVLAMTPCLSINRTVTFDYPNEQVLYVRQGPK